jgi:DnaJ family protein C protein 28
MSAMPNIEELLNKAMQDGKFDDLPGKGKPLKLDEANVHADPEWELAYHMLKDAGYSLQWIELYHEIENDLFNARSGLKRAFDWRKTVTPGTQLASQVDAEWQRALATFNAEIASINQRLRVYNLQVPNPRFQRLAINLQAEVDRIISG